ncbi:DNA transposase THAP9 [Merluccius polli]|uniref:DNA transposase THAP9 n=1 Tax=Merluccius polli TaxID=89951 RepID=A0AA47MYI0_MERPO|nr:DNA transposase THAP9 [Merluccius polli]
MAPSYCSVPGCSSNRKNMPYLSFHDFPADLELRTSWVRAMRRDEGPQFKILRGSTFICSLHFTEEDMHVSASGRKKLKKGAVPSRFIWNDFCKGNGSQPRESPYQRARKRLAELPVPESSENVEPDAVLDDHDYTSHPSPGKLDRATWTIQQLEVQVITLQHEIQQLTLKNRQPLIFKFCVTDEDYRYYTRFSSKEVFTVFWESVYPSASRLVYWSNAQRAAEVMPSPQRKLELIDELFMFLCRIAAGLQERTLSSLFEVSVSTVSRVILTWTSYLYQVLCSLPSWMTREQVQATMPDKFRLYCPQLRVIIDCTEIRCETASSLSLQSETFSTYKNHTTFKGTLSNFYSHLVCPFKCLIGVAPCGVVTFVSTLYTGSVSDIDITRRSKLLQLLQPGDEVMADKGFVIERMLSEVGAKLIIPPFKKSTQFTKEDTEKTQAIARLRILVERAIRRVKEYHIWDGLVPLSMVGSVNQLWAICCLMSNYQGPLDVKGDKPV